MRSKLLHFLLLFGVFFAFSAKGYAKDTLCIHVDVNLVHLEQEHAEVPTDKDEVHLKLFPEISGKLFKLSLDIDLSPESKFISFGQTLRGFLVHTPLKYPPLKVHNQLRSVRLLI
ncbi:hypothetical protein [Hydrogenivirga sp.]